MLTAWGALENTSRGEVWEPALPTRTLAVKVYMDRRQEGKREEGRER